MSQNSQSSENENYEDSLDDLQEDHKEVLGKRKGKPQFRNPEKKTKRDNKGLFEDEAEESENDSDNDNKSNKRVEVDDKQYRKQLEEYDNRKKNRVPQVLKIENEEEIENYYKFQQQDDIEIDQDEHYQQYLLPKLKDPKIWMVTCEPKKERILTLRILNKFYHLSALASEGKEQDIQQLNNFKIISANYLDKHPGYIFVEAFMERDVINALEGFEHINLTQITQIPLDKVPNIFKPKEEVQYNAEPGQYVRIKKGLYKNDLGKIDHIDQNNIASVLVVPRIDIHAIEEEQEKRRKLKDQKKNKKIEDVDNLDDFDIANQEGQQQLNNARKKGQQDNLNEAKRPMQKFLNLDEEAINEYFNNHQNQFKDGYFIRKVHLKNLILEGINHTPQELKNYHQENNIHKIIQNNPDLQKSQINTYKFEKGDKIRVISGELKNTQGRVISIGSDNRVKFQPTIRGLGECDTHIGDIIKVFNEGDHIKVIDGTHKGKTGYVLSIRDNTIATVFTDNNNEIKVRTEDMRISSEKRVEEREGIKLKKFELIKLNGYHEVGLVLSIENDNIKIINENNQLKLVNFMDLDSKIDSSRNITKNQRQEEISMDCTVRIIDGPHKNVQALVKQVHNDNLFLFNKDFFSTQGIVAEKCNNCQLITKGRTYQKIIYYNSKGNNQEQEQGNKNEDIESCVGKTLTILKGPYKGYQGQVIQVTGNQVVIHLQAKNKRVTIDKDCIKRPQEIAPGKTPKHLEQSVYFQSPHIGNSPGYTENYNNNKNF